MLIQEWEPGRLWYVDMPYKKLGLMHTHRMVIIKYDGDYLLIHSPVELNTALQTELSALGVIKGVIVPSPTYHQHLSEWWLSYTDAQFFATPTVIQKRSDLNFDGALSSKTPDLWKSELYQTAVLGMDNPRKLVMCDPKSRTLILSDNLLAVQPELPLGQKLLTWAYGVNKELKLPFSDKRHIDNMPLLRASVQEIMTWPFERLISNNGLKIEKNAKESFYQAFWWAF
ncbi:hypothetical protein P7F88_07030 [Vibrio hannami]|uniref:hypothetical protein n=1 Tax=Vibrio hannami TaxID=2717094 RepID=UPI00240EBE30|nr:hypothetical protein [Vibrio hannami]MDG3085860.1 hypothetical protein [Vibrio hannami]